MGSTNPHEPGNQAIEPGLLNQHHASYLDNHSLPPRSILNSVQYRPHRHPQNSERQTKGAEPTRKRRGINNEYPWINRGRERVHLCLSTPVECKSVPMDAYQGPRSRSNPQGAPPTENGGARQTTPGRSMRHFWGDWHVLFVRDLPSDVYRIPD